MGLCAHAKGLTEETEFDCGYLTYGRFLRNLAYAYNEEIGKMFESMCSGNQLTEQQESRWNEICNDDLDLLLFHSDCDGKFTPQECRRIYNAIKDLHMDMQGHNYIVMKPYNMLEHWKNIFLHCAKRRVNLYYS